MRARLSARGLACAITAGALAGGAALPAAGGADSAEDRTTLERTILDTDRDNRLQLAPGERYEVRQTSVRRCPVARVVGRRGSSSAS